MGLETARRVRSRILQASVSDVVGFADGLHLNQVGDVARFIKVGCGDQLSQTLKRFVNIAVKETSREKQLLLTRLNVLVVVRLGVRIDIDLNAVCATEHLVVESVVFVILGADAGEEFFEHGKKEALLLG